MLLYYKAEKTTPTGHWRPHPPREHSNFEGPILLDIVI